MIQISKLLPFSGHGDRFFNILGHPYFISRYQLRRALSRIHINPSPGNVLDVGCGSMPYRDLFPASTIYEGLEIDQPRNHSNQLVTYFYNGKHFPLPNNSFDVVLCSQVLEHCFTPDSLLFEISRVLRPNGHLIITIPFLWPEHEQPYDSQRFTSFGLQDILVRSGFQIVHLEKTNSGVSSLIQLAVEYQESLTRPIQRHSRYLWLLLRLILLIPLTIANLLALISTWLIQLFSSGSSSAFFLDNVLLAKKAEL